MGLKIIRIYVESDTLRSFTLETKESDRGRRGTNHFRVLNIIVSACHSRVLVVGALNACSCNNNNFGEINFLNL